MLEWITRAEQGPFSSLAVTDRVVSGALEPLIVLGIAAGATKRIRLMTSVVIGPARETTLLARQAATIDTLSAGRLTLGIGIVCAITITLPPALIFTGAADVQKNNFQYCGASGEAIRFLTM